MSGLAATRRSVLGLLGGLSIFRPARAAAADAFTLVAQLAPGQSLAWRQDVHLVRNGAVGHRSSTRATLQVDGRIDGGWLVRWTTHDSRLHDADPRVRPLLELMHRIWDDVPVEVVLDDTGAVRGLADPRDVRVRMAASVDGLVGTLARDASRAALEAPVRAAMQPMLASDDLLASSVLKEMRILLGAMGRDYRVGQPLEVASRIPSPLGTGEIPILGRFTVRGVEPARRRAHLGWLMVVDRPHAARVVGDEVQVMLAPVAESLAAARADARPEDVPALAAQALAGFDFDDRAEFEVDTDTAWPERVRHTRRVAGSGASRVETVEFNRLAD